MNSGNLIWTDHNTIKHGYHHIATATSFDIIMMFMFNMRSWIQMNRQFYSNSIYATSVEGFSDVDLSITVAIDSSCTQQFGKTADVTTKAHLEPLSESHTPN